MGLARIRPKRGGEPLDVLIVAPGDVKGCRRALFDVMAAATFVFDSPPAAAKLAASRNEFGQSSQAVHGSQQLIKLAAVYLIFERLKAADKFDSTMFNVAFRIFNNKVRGLYSDVEIPEGDVHNFSSGVEDGDDLLGNACRAAGTALYVSAQARSIIPTLESEFPAQVNI